MPLGRPWKVWSLTAAFLFFLFALLHPSSRTYYDDARARVKSYAGSAGLGQATNSGGPLSTGDMAMAAGATFPSDSSHPLPSSDQAKTFWTQYAQVLANSKFSFPGVRRKADAGPTIPITYADSTLWTQRPDHLILTDEEVKEMKENHANALSQFKQIADQLPFNPGTRGIIFTTSIEGMGFMTVSIRMLRKTGTRLPIEIWFYDRSEFAVDPYGLQMCEKIWKPLDATCMFMTDYLPTPRPPPLDQEPHIFEHKLDALLFSTFEQVLFLDSDNFPIMPVEEIFVHEPFLSNGFVLWPDYWAEPTSHYYYEITGLSEPGITDRASTESGTILVNKNTHGAALLMSSYYQRHAKHYSVLASQDLLSLGDKDHFLKASLVAGLPVYQLHEGPERMGYRCSPKEERAIASGQHHPLDDYFLVQQNIHRGRRQDLLADNVMPRIMFIHGNMPKYDPVLYLDWYDEQNWPDQLRCERGKGKAHRMYGTKSLTILKFGWDVEKALWDQLHWTSCETEKYAVNWWNGTVYNDFKPRMNVCEDMKRFYHELLTVQEGLVYDPSLKSPYVRGGEYEMRLKENYERFDAGFGRNWMFARSGIRWVM